VSDGGKRENKYYFLFFIIIKSPNLSFSFTI